MADITLERINAAVKEDAAGFVAECCRRYSADVEKAVDGFVEQGKRLIMLAGPSSSGKTTTAGMIAAAVERRGFEAYVVSLDDFYLPNEEDYPLDANGEADYETVDALDLPLAAKCFSELLLNGFSRFPVFDFENHCRSERTRGLRLGEKSFLIVEGLHALNPRISGQLPGDSMARVYVSVSSRVYDNDGNAVISKRNLRLERRMIRDLRCRATTPRETLERWQSVLEGEDKYIFPFEDLADVKLDSFHPCEPCFFVKKAMELFDNSDIDEVYSRAGALMNALKQITPLDADMLPADALLHEFVG